MARRFGHRPKIVGSRNKTLAEMVKPNAIHHHARRERIVFARDRAGEFKASAADFVFGANRTREHFEKTSRNNRAAVLGFVASDKKGVAAARQIFKHHRA